MADRIIKPDSGNDVVIQNNGGTRKIEVTNSGDVEVTGDFKATTVKATNLKANDGTASLEIADSTGDIGFSANTNLKIKLPSAGGIYESDGSTQVLTESGGSVTIENATFNGTIGSNVSGIGQLVGVSYLGAVGDGNYVTVENNKTYHVFIAFYDSNTSAGYSEYWECSVNGSGTVTATQRIDITGSVNITHTTNAIRVSSSNNRTYLIAFVYEQGTTFDNS